MLVSYIMLKKTKLRKNRGGNQRGGNQKGGNQKGGFLLNEFNPLNLVLLGVIVFLLYQMTNKNNTDIIVKEKIIYQPTLYESESDDEEPYREDIYKPQDMYKPDIKRSISSPPFNYPTRGPPQEYDMVGFLQDPDDSNKLQQLYGRRTYPNSNNWNYFVKSDQYHQIPIPVSIGGQNCTDERGCKELNNQDSLNLFNKEHTATIYKPEPYYYNPFSV